MHELFSSWGSRFSKRLFTPSSKQVDFPQVITDPVEKATYLLQNITAIHGRDNFHLVPVDWNLYASELGPQDSNSAGALLAAYGEATSFLKTLKTLELITLENPPQEERSPETSMLFKLKNGDRLIRIAHYEDHISFVVVESVEALHVFVLAKEVF